jgi:hypothetical protein
LSAKGARPWQTEMSAPPKESGSRMIGSHFFSSDF